MAAFAASRFAQVTQGSEKHPPPKISNDSPTDLSCTKPPTLNGILFSVVPDCD